MRVRGASWLAGGIGACSLAACWLTRSFDSLVGPDGPCTAPLADCDGAGDNGCETRLDTDAKNCGACGHDCIETTCVNSQCQPRELVAGEASPKGLAKLGDYLYWADYGDRGVPNGSIRQLDLSIPNAKPTDFQQGLSTPTGIAIDVESNTLYWTEFDPGLIRGADLQSGALKEIVADGGVQSEGLAVHSKYLYWTTTYAGDVTRAPLRFWYEASTLAHLNTCAEDAGVLSCPLGIVVDDVDVFWTDVARGTIDRIPPDAGAADAGVSVTVWLDGQTEPNYVTVDATHVYWTNRTEGTVNRKARDGSGGKEVIATNQGLPAGIVVDDTYVYWANRSKGSIMRVAK